MRNAITATRNDINARFDRRFGRCAWFFVWDMQSREGWFVHNPGATLDTEAGAAAVNVLLSEQVDRIFSGDLGAETLKRLMDSGIGSFLLRDHHRSLAEILNIKDNPIIIKPDLL